MTALLQDVRYASRQLRNNIGITVVAAVTLALGIGVNTAIFSIANTLLFRRLPFDHPERLIAIVGEQVQTKDTVQASWADLQDLRAHTGTFDGVAAYRCSANSWISPQSGSSAQRVTVVET